MRQFLYIILFLCSFNNLHANTLKVAVIDTGLDLKWAKSVPLCQNEHKDFTGEGLNDTHGHGTNIIGLIVDNANTSNYCIVIIKAYSFIQNKSFLVQALQYAYHINANIINLSGGGLGQQYYEKLIVEKILDKKITLIVASGNNFLNLDKECIFYPACYDKRIYVIGNNAPSSNYGSIVDQVIDGNNKVGLGIRLSGSSQSTAIFTGQLLKQIALLQKNR